MNIYLKTGKVAKDKIDTHTHTNNVPVGSNGQNHTYLMQAPYGSLYGFSVGKQQAGLPTENHIVFAKCVHAYKNTYRVPKLL